MTSAPEVESLAPIEVGSRLERLRACLDGARVGALLVTNLVNVRYLTGFTGSAGVVLVGGGRAMLTTDGRYRTQATEQLGAAGLEGEVELVVGNVEVQREALAGLAGVSRPSGRLRIGLEAEHVTWAAQRRWAELFERFEVVATSGVVERLREVKDAGEVARISRAAAIADRALAEVVPMLSEGREEAEVALVLDGAMRRLGAEDRAFETIVASGPNTAKPHAQPTRRRIAAGDLVVVDFGATFDGYRSDMTRTFCVGGEPVGVLASVRAVVVRSQAAGLSAVVAGAEGAALDRVCREVIAEAGWAEAFEHGTGHGVGLDIHEAPSLSSTSTAILPSGAVVTVEPGVYLAGVGGVRVEDMVLVTDDGCRVLTHFPKDVAA